MRLIFLDIDGVLNGDGWYKHPLRKLLMKLYHLKPANNITMLSPINVRWLKKLVKRYPDTKVVLSSSWRYTWEREVECQKYLKSQSIEIWSSTPIGECEIDSSKQIDWDICSSLLKTRQRLNFNGEKDWSLDKQREQFLKYARGTQIVSWFKEQNIDLDSIPFVILEDDYKEVSCYNCLKDHVVITSFYNKYFGFRKNHYKKAVKILKGKY